MAPRKKYYNPDPQSYFAPEIPEDIPQVDPDDDFDVEPEEDDSKEEMIMDHGIEADNNGGY